MVQLHKSYYSIPKQGHKHVDAVGIWKLVATENVDLTWMQWTFDSIGKLALKSGGLFLTEINAYVTYSWHNVLNERDSTYTGVIPFSPAFGASSHGDVRKLCVHTLAVSSSWH